MHGKSVCMGGCHRASDCSLLLCDEGYEEKTVPVRLDVSLQCAAGYRARIVPVNLETQEKLGLQAYIQNIIR